VGSPKTKTVFIVIFFSGLRSSQHNFWRCQGQSAWGRSVQLRGSRRVGGGPRRLRRIADHQPVDVQRGKESQDPRRKSRINHIWSCSAGWLEVLNCYCSFPCKSSFHIIRQLRCLAINSIQTVGRVLKRRHT